MESNPTIRDTIIPYAYQDLLKVGMPSDVDLILFLARFYIVQRVDCVRCAC